ncbi:MAG: hypothetical protein SPH38_06885, partial [Eubacteriales bacterium]|nr:hypothetical protein [Eubacteriales bacterium]
FSFGACAYGAAGTKCGESLATQGLLRICLFFFMLLPGFSFLFASFCFSFLLKRKEKEDGGEASIRVSLIYF